MNPDKVSFLSVSFLRKFLPKPHVAPFSFLHPGALLLFSDRLSYFALSLPSFGSILMAESLDGIRFLPLPPPFFWESAVPAGARREGVRRFVMEISVRSSLGPGHSDGGLRPRIDNCPLALSGIFPVRSQTDVEYVIGRKALLVPSGNPGRSSRWELNRFSRDHPAAVVRPMDTKDLPEVAGLVERFVRQRIDRAEDSYGRAMAEDMGSAFSRAIRFGTEWELMAWVLEEKGRILGAQWYGLSTDEKTLVCFLEARDEELSNLGTFMTREILLSMKSVDWVNIAGSGGLPEIEHSKRIRPHTLEIPLYSVSLA